MALLPPVPSAYVFLPLHLQVLDSAIVLKMVNLYLKPTLTVRQADLDPIHFWVAKRKLVPFV